MSTTFISLYTGKKAYFILPILILAISDLFKALLGLNYKSGYWTNILTGERSSKTFNGLFAFFVSLSILIFSGLPFLNYINPMAKFIISISISLIVTIIEVVSLNGIDNV
jgi:dolichol kinase